MNEVVIPKHEVFNLEELSMYIEKVEDHSDGLFKRLRLYFKNGFGLSIINGEYSYGGKQGLYEIMALDSSLETHIFGEPVGYLSVEDVMEAALDIAKNGIKVD